MNSKQKKTLNEIFKNPIKSSILWSDVESLFRTLGAHIEDGSGSKVCIILNNVIAVFHRPHPQKETDKGAIKSIRRFLENAGVKHDEL